MICLLAMVYNLQPLKDVLVDGADAESAPLHNGAKHMTKPMNAQQIERVNVFGDQQRESHNELRQNVQSLQTSLSIASREEIDEERKKLLLDVADYLAESIKRNMVAIESFQQLIKQEANRHLKST